MNGSIKQDVGPYPAGTPYGAADPELLMWVLFTVVDSALLVYSKYVRTLDDDEQGSYWEDNKIVGKLFGLRRRLLRTVNFITIDLLPDEIRRQYGFTPIPFRGVMVDAGAEWVKRIAMPVKRLAS